MVEKVLRGRQRLELQNGSKSGQLWFLGISVRVVVEAFARVACGFSFGVLLASARRRCYAVD